MPRDGNMSSWWWCGKEAAYEPLESRAKGVVGAVQSSTKALVVFFLVLLALVAFISSRWFDGTTFTMVTSWGQQPSRSHRRHYRSHSRPVTLTCPNQTTAQTQYCRRFTYPSPPVSLSPSPSPSPSPLPIASSEPPPPSCPDYFRWIHEDLRPWRSTGITREMVESAQKLAAFRLLVIDGRVYVEQYHRVFQTRDLFTLWGFVQLANRYPGYLPDLDLMFNCEDVPTVKAADYKASPPPPLFRYCKDDTTVDIVFPDWSFWGWPEINIKPWEPLSEEMKEANERVKWKKRKPYAYWKGNPGVSRQRQDLLKCNLSNGHDWNARVFAQNWEKETQNGFKESNLAEQCMYRYKIFVEGRAWSVSEKYTLACDSPALFVTTHFYDFMTRGLIPGRHYWPIRETAKCRSIKFAVDWGNKHQKKAQAMGKEGSRFILEEVKMDYVYQYMLHLLTEYANLLRYKPTLPEKATDLCLESVACREQGRVKEFLMQSMVKRTSDSEPCDLPPAYTSRELEELRSRKAEAVKQVEKWEQESWH
ncbi:unnamed protein product [Musa hybrid cultivar]